MTQFRVTESIPADLPDVVRFAEAINHLEDHVPSSLLPFFTPGHEVFVTRAPGRIDLMGGIADYSGSHVLQWPTREAACAALQMRAEPEVTVVSFDAKAYGEPVTATVKLDGTGDDGTPHWVSYVAGAFVVLKREKGVQFQHGARILISSDVPWGKGVSSSAAIEVAAMYAIDAAYGLHLSAREMAVLCQKVENEIAGAPCGVMDQMTASCGEEGWLLSLLCQPAELKGTIPLPNDIAVWGIDSGIRHAVTGSDYSSVRTGAFMGYRIIADLAGLDVEKSGDVVAVRDPHWNGYLANIDPREFEDRFADHLPESMTGAEFLEKYGGTTDRLSRIDPEKEYAIRTPAAHPIYENHRVRQFEKLLAPSASRQSRPELGQLMYESHASYNACGLGSEATDRIVELVRHLDQVRGLYGAKITGGGSGGTVAVLGDKSAGPAIRDIVDDFHKETGYNPHVFSGSSPSASQFGHITLEYRGA
ncbi:MAG: GHMP kinase [Verrucomicrobia bacterium]|nr:GHMP kinase [Verrucomicrobiota bacterium]